MPPLVPELVDREHGVFMFTAPNPGPKTLSGSHSYVVADSPAYVIDPGPADEGYQRLLSEWLTGSGLAVEGILLTHGHPDHAPGASILKRLVHAPVWASGTMSGLERGVAGVDLDLAPSQHFTLRSDALVSVPSPGHSPDHVAFWMPGARILFSGDVILGTGTTLISPPDGDMSTYMETLHRLFELDARIIAPGHGPLVHDPAAKIAEYVRHRVMREMQLVEVLRAGPANIPGLVARVYLDLDSSLHDLAAASVEAQLVKLEREGRVRRSGGEYELTDTAS